MKECIKDKKGSLKAVKSVSVEGKREENGRMNFTEIAGSEKVLDADLVLIAAGFIGAEDYVVNAFKLEVDARNNVKTVPGEYQTNIDKVFVTGDMHRGQSLVVWAIREGREVAIQVDESLLGYTNLVVQ